MKQEKMRIVNHVVNEILENIPKRPMFCLPLSALLYAILRDNHSIDSRFVTGNLLYNGEYIFKQDFNLSNVDDGKFRQWAGHAWIKIEDLVCDLSFFRTLYSDRFNKPCRQELINVFGEGRGALILSDEQSKAVGFEYQSIDELSDETATGIIRGIDDLLARDGG